MRLKPFRLWLYRLLVHNLPETRCFGLKVFLLRWCGVQIGENVRINSSAVFSGDGSLTIGDDVWIGAGTFICPVGDGSVTIGSHVDLGPQVMIVTGSHEIDLSGLHIGGGGSSSPVVIGDGCWLGARALILPGVTLQRKTLVAAGAVMTEGPNVGNCLLAGVPARVRRRWEVKR